MKLFSALALTLLGGCALVQQAPSLKYCDHVSYTRDGRKVHVEADCFEAVESMLPLPIIPKGP